MKKVAFVALTAFALMHGGISLAADKAEATLSAPLSQPRKVIIDGRLWSCEGEKCTAGPQGKNQPISRECSRAAKFLGQIVAYRQGNRELDTIGLAACNGAAATARAPAGASADVAARTR